MTEEGSPQTAPFFVRVTGPSNREVEEQLAEMVEEAIQGYDGRDLGERRRRDARDGRLRVDFTYDTASRPVAMEIYRPVEECVAALGSELFKLEGQLRAIAQAEELGTWMFGVRVGTHRRQIAEPLAELMRDQGTGVGDVLLSADESTDDLNDDRRRVAHLLELGLFSALRLDRGHDVHFVPPISDASVEGGFAAVLQDAMIDNATKLREAEYPESHLVVAIDGLAVSNDPARTPAPQLLDGIDVLWVFLGYYNAKTSSRLWRTTGDQRWDLLNHPFGRQALD